MSRESNGAKALIRLIDNRDAVERLFHIWTTTPALEKVLKMPDVSVEKKAAIARKTAELAGSPEVLCDFLQYFIREQKVSYIEGILKSYLREWDQQHEVVRVTVTYAAEPDQEEQKKTEEYLAGRFPGSSLKITMNVDPKLLGGKVIVAGNEVLDLSYEGCLQALAARIGA